MALRSRAVVAEATRRHVEAVAEEMGYRVHGAASVLAQRRHARSSGRGTRTLPVACFGNTHRLGRAGRGNREGLIRSLGEAQGLDFSFWHPDDFASPAAASRVLWSRGVQGLLIGPETLSGWSAKDRVGFVESFRDCEAWAFLRGPTFSCRTNGGFRADDSHFGTSPRKWLPSNCRAPASFGERCRRPSSAWGAAGVSAVGKP